MDSAEADLSAGIAHHRAGRIADAAASYHRVLSADPSHPDALRMLALIAREAGNLDESAELLNRALAEMPDAAELHVDLAEVERRRGNRDAALASAAAAVRLDPVTLGAERVHARALEESGRFAESLAAWRRAVVAHPEDAEAHVGLGQSLLLHGQWGQGWREYDWRWRLLRGGTFPYEKWDGSPLGGRTLLVYGEQGWGDNFQFARLPALARDKVGGPVIFACPPDVAYLLVPQCGITVVPGGRLPRFDLGISIIDLARVLNVTEDDLPGPIPYLVANPADAPRAVKELAGRRIGLAWQGHPDHPRDRDRSIPSALLAPLLDVPGVTWVSVAKEHRPPHGVLDLSADIRDFRDTAAILANLDLLVTVDTSVAHLAGAMGVPTWLLLPHFPDWRWLLDREDSPWYPSVRLFRQSSRADWAGVIERVRAELLRR